jgi:L-ribulose-5-phosphate 3-epimerase
MQAEDAVSDQAENQDQKQAAYSTPSPLIALAGWSLHRRFRRQQDPLPLLDFPRIAAEEFGITAIELNSPFFKYRDPEDPGRSPLADGYLERLREAADQAGVRIVGVAVDHHGDLSSTDETARASAVEQHVKWCTAGRQLGARYFRANSGGSRQLWVRRAHETACTRSFAALAERAAECDLDVLMENHWGLSQDPDRMARILRAVDHPRCGALADFRNWPKSVDPYAALETIAPFARVAHAKFLAFDERGEDPDFDAARAINILRAAGFAGIYAIEFEGELDDHQGVLQSKELLKRHL